MFGFLTIGRLVFKATPVGAAFSAFRSALYAADFLFDLALAQETKEQAQKGVNREEERFHHETYGGTEPLFPFFLDKEEFPEPLGKLIEDGHFIWKPSEWTEFLQWVSVLLTNLEKGTDKPSGRDGQWLLHIGRERWADSKWREDAFKNVELHPDVVSRFPYIQKTSG